MTADPDYSAAYVTLTSDDGLEGHGFTFTEGRGNELCVAAIEALAARVDGLDLDEVRADPGEIFRRVTGDPQLRWLGPEKGVIHLATAAVVNAVWDMWARAEGKPLWQLRRRPVARAVRRLRPLPVPHRRARPGIRARAARGARRRQGGARAEMERDGFPAYTTSAGLARLLPRRDPPARPRGGRGGLEPLQDEGRRAARGRRAPRGHPARGDRARAPADDGRQSGLGRPRGDREDPRARRVRAVLDGGAHEPRRRARPRRDREGDRPDRRRHRRALP